MTLQLGSDLTGLGPGGLGGDGRWACFWGLGLRGSVLVGAGDFRDLRGGRGIVSGEEKDNGKLVMWKMCFLVFLSSYEGSWRWPCQEIGPASGARRDVDIEP